MSNVAESPRVDWTVKELADKAEVSGQYIRRLISEGELPGTYKVGNVWLIPKATAERWLARRQANN